MIDTFSICGFHLSAGEFSTRIASVITSDFRIFDFTAPVYYLTIDGELLCLPKDAFTDLASIPRPLWSLLPPQGENGAEYGLAAAAHDFMYRNTMLLWSGTAWVKAAFPKSKCDLLLKEMMLGCQVPELIAETIYQAVNLAGESSFNGDR
jgi:hypothetical protein